MILCRRSLACRIGFSNLSIGCRLSRPLLRKRRCQWQSGLSVTPEDLLLARQRSALPLALPGVLSLFKRGNLIVLSFRCHDWSLRVKRGNSALRGALERLASDVIVADFVREERAHDLKLVGTFLDAYGFLDQFDFLTPEIL